MTNAHFGPLETDVKVSLLPRFREAEIEALGSVCIHSKAWPARRLSRSSSSKISRPAQIKRLAVVFLQYLQVRTLLGCVRSV